MSNQIVAITYSCGCVMRPLQNQLSAYCRIAVELARRCEADEQRAAGDRPRYRRLTEAATSMHLKQMTEDR